MNGYDSLDDVLDAVESDLEFDEELEALLESDIDAAPRRSVRRRPVPTGRGANYYTARPVNQHVTQAQLQAALAKISKDVKANAVGIKTVGTRVDGVAAEQKKHTDALKKEIAARRRETAQLKSNMQMSAMLPLLTSKSITVPAGGTVGGKVVDKETKLMVAPDGFAALMPLLMFGDGFGGGSGDSSSGLIMALALSGSL